MSARLRGGEPPTDRQREVLAYIVDRAVSLEPTTVREAMRHFGFASTNAIADFAKALKRKGLLRESETKTRSGNTRFLLPTAAGYRQAGYEMCKHCGAVS